MSAELTAAEMITRLTRFDPVEHRRMAVGGRRYSDPYFSLEETGEEDDARIRDAFGRTAVLPLDPATTYPVCVAFEGESPEEYPDED